MSLFARSVMLRYLQSVALTWLAVVAVFLVADFGDRMKAFIDRPAADVAALYANKALVAVHQLGPVAMLLAGGLLVSAMRRQGEVHAALSLGGSPWRIAGPIAAVAVALGAGLAVYDELVVTRASEQVDRIQVERFQSWGDFRLFFGQRQWFRVGEWIVQIREGGLRNVTLYRVDANFHLQERVDATALESLGGDRWQLTEVSDRLLAHGGGAFTREATRALRLPGSSPGSFSIREGRPEQLRLSELFEQQAARAQVGLPVRRYALAVQQRFAFPVSGVLAVVLGVLLALRRERRNFATAALIEGLLVVALVWGLLIIARALAFSGTLSPSLAPWVPALALVAAMAELTRREGLWARQPARPSA
ncbi:MAG: LptF/LptG family permease [Myxococcaceae bacterium]|nr:LptF/LptG family permease [Myxococcaceae bacterium]